MQAHFFENTSGLKSLLENVNHLKSELDALRPLNAEQEARVMQKFRLDWNYHSNSIEGNSLTYGETIAFLMEGLTAKGKPFKDHLDIKGHNEAINYLMDMVKNRQELTEKTIREMHSIILVEPYKTPAQTSDGQRVEKTVTLGAYKKMPNHVKTPTGEIHYYATPDETPAKMADLMSWLHEEQGKNELHPLAIAAIFHYRFVAIHPFDDGNGRMSRLLMNLILMQYGYPPVVIKQEERNLYYNALRQADSGDLGAFVEFIGENLVRGLEIYLRGAKGESIEEKGDWRKKVTLLKTYAENKKIADKKRKLDLSKASAQWLETNIPLIEKEMVKNFKDFSELFDHSELKTFDWNNLVERPNWENISNEVAKLKTSKLIKITYIFGDLIYKISSGSVNFSPAIDITLSHTNVIMYSGWIGKEKAFEFNENLTQDDLRPIHQLAETFYEIIKNKLEDPNSSFE